MLHRFNRQCALPMQSMRRVLVLDFSLLATAQHPIRPGDLLVTSDRPGYVMASNNPKDGTVVGKSFDFCDEDYCTGLVFVALS